MKKQTFASALRSLRLLHFADRMRFWVQRVKNRKANKTFKKEYPDVKLPPDYLMYESFQLNYSKYYHQSKKAASSLIKRLSEHIELKDKKILDWGCGPGRMIRHFPELVGNGCSYYGTDYNAQSIKWCSNNLPGIEFNNNSLEARLPYENGTFDVIYGLSIFTHLSEQMHYDWFRELYRILKSGGIMYLTTQGDTYKPKLTATELIQYEKGDLVIRGAVKEGHRTYAAFHPKTFMHELFKEMTILDHIEEPAKGGWYPQDKWIVRKN